jgi:hypothetical protein
VTTEQPVFSELPLGAIKPLGWLAEQLQLQADGLTGALEGLWPDVGPESAWLGGKGEDWERGPYYLDGLIPLAHITGDVALLRKAEVWVEAILGSARDNGQFGPKTNDDWWPRMIALKALTQRYEATRDDRILALADRYFDFQARTLGKNPLAGWGWVRGGENVLSVMWLYDHTGQNRLLNLSKLLLDQTADWGAWFAQLPARDVTRTWSHMTHVVNVAMGLKVPAIRFLVDGRRHHEATLTAGLANLDRFHGQVHGLFSGDEWLAGHAPTLGVELCAVVEAMFSYEQIFRIFGKAWAADRLENIAFNLLPASMTSDVRAHQYHQQANQVLASIAQREWTAAGDDSNIFGLEPNFGCCTANLHQGWPKFVHSMWMEHRASGGLAATALGPSSVTWDCAGTHVTIKTHTDYPFDENLTFRVTAAQEIRFELRIRVPGWCASPRLLINGQDATLQRDDGFLVLDRKWLDDEVRLCLPMELEYLERANDAMGVRYGPLLLAYSPGEVWARLPDSLGFGDFEVRPRRSWNIALLTSQESKPTEAAIERFGRQSPPFGLKSGPPAFGVDNVPLKVWVRGAPLGLAWQMEENSAAPTPSREETRKALSHLSSEAPDLVPRVPLVPYGCARIRIAEFPTFSLES